MRQIINFNAKWAFTKQANEVPAAMPADWNFINLPHSCKEQLLGINAQLNMIPKPRK